MSRDTFADRDWILCPDCRSLVYGKRLARNLGVCPECGAHHRLAARARIVQLLDPGSIELIEPVIADLDPLDFNDTVPYRERVVSAREKTGLDEAVLLARGTIEGNRVLVAVMDFGFLGGSLGCVVGELVTMTAELALAEHVPLLLVTASGGARMQEGVLSLMQMAKTSQALGQLDEAGVLTISLITDPTYGGVAASYATLCDVILAEPRARLGFAGPRVIQQTIRQTLPAGFQTAEFLLERGLIDGIRPRGSLRASLARLLSVGGGQNGQAADSFACSTSQVVVRDPGRMPEREAWQVVQLARNLARPTTADYLCRAFEDFEELHGDRVGGGDCGAVIGGFARIDGIPVMVIGNQKGHRITELAERNYGMPTPAGYRKAARLLRLAEKLRLPVVTIIDTPGAYPGIAAEEQGQAIAVAENIRLMAGLGVPIVSIITGEGGSGGALALGVGDRVLACSNAVYSVISPEGCAAILWNDSSKAPAAATALRVDARELLRFGIVDGVIVEPAGGAHTDQAEAAERFKLAVVASLAELSTLSPAELLAARRARFRAYGAPEADSAPEELTYTGRP